MPGEGLDKNILVEGIQAANKAVKDMTDPEQIEKIWAEKLADSLDLFVRSGKVITVGSATAQQGTIT